MSNVHALQVLRCGDQWLFAGPVNDAAGNALNLTGASISWKLDSVDGKTNYLTLTVGSGVTITTNNPGAVAYGPTKVQTAALTAGTYYDYLIVTLADGTTYTVIEGLINALPAAT